MLLSPRIGSQSREDTGPKVALNYSNRFYLGSAFLGQYAELHYRLIAIVVVPLICLQSRTNAGP